MNLTEINSYFRLSEIKETISIITLDLVLMIEKRILLYNKPKTLPFVCLWRRGGEVFVREPNSYTMKYLNSKETSENLEPLEQRQNIERRSK